MAKIRFEDMTREQLSAERQACRDNGESWAAHVEMLKAFGYVVPALPATDDDIEATKRRARRLED